MFFDRQRFNGLRTSSCRCTCASGRRCETRVVAFVRARLGGTSCGSLGLLLLSGLLGERAGPRRSSGVLAVGTLLVLVLHHVRRKLLLLAVRRAALGTALRTAEARVAASTSAAEVLRTAHGHSLVL